MSSGVSLMGCWLMSVIEQSAITPAFALSKNAESWGEVAMGRMSGSVTLVNGEWQSGYHWLSRQTRASFKPTTTAHEKVLTITAWGNQCVRPGQSEKSYSTRRRTINHSHRSCAVYCVSWLYSSLLSTVGRYGSYLPMPLRGVAQVINMRWVDR